MEAVNSGRHVSPLLAREYARGRMDVCGDRWNDRKAAVLCFIPPVL